MYLATPPATDLSRSRLRQLASWIRDDLDPVFAREGPESLRADDVLALHEFFHALRTSSTITALDLRATGIHKAVMEVAGTATRWPGRLVDDCDRIIFVWRGRFGRLEDLRPFMYGRGGRLEGIAGPDDFSKAALLKRWKTMCPEKLSIKRSHRLGDLGFKPGSWWLSPLFAYHAGIIGLQTLEGGVCFDEYGCYALVLKERGEFNPTEEGHFTYRCAQGDKGKFRLTSADPRSRYPIRVFRCHDLNSMFGPKAGIRYEGAHHTVGWTVRTAKADDAIGKQYKTGDIIYEVKFERVDPVPLEEVMRHPTATELDDYAEYKRLRRVHREGRNARFAFDNSDAHLPIKAAPLIPPLNTIAAQLRASSILSPSHSRAITFKDPFGLEADSNQRQPNPTKPSPAGSRTTPPSVPQFMNNDLSALDLQKNTLGVPAVPITGRPSSLYNGDSVKSDSNLQVQNSNSPSGSKKSGQNPHIDIKEVAPWIDYDLELIAAAPSITTRPDKPTAKEDPTAADTPAKARTRVKSGSRSAHSLGFNSGCPSSPEEGPPAKKKEGSMLKPPMVDQKKRDDRTSVMVSLTRSRNPLAKVFDGTSDGAVEEMDNFSRKTARPASFSSKPSLPMVGRHIRASSSDATMDRPLSPTPIRLADPLSPLITNRRGAIAFWVSTMMDYYQNIYAQSARDVASDDNPIREQVKSHSGPSRLPIALNSFISVAKVAEPVSVSAGASTALFLAPRFPAN